MILCISVVSNSISFISDLFGLSLFTTSSFFHKAMWNLSSQIRDRSPAPFIVSTKSFFFLFTVFFSCLALFFFFFFFNIFFLFVLTMSVYSSPDMGEHPYNHYFEHFFFSGRMLISVLSSSFSDASCYFICNIFICFLVFPISLCLSIH